MKRALSITGIVVLLMLVIAPASYAAPPLGEGLAPSCIAQHEVRAGDNVFRIAINNGLTQEQLAEANNIVKPGLIEVGRVLCIPPAGGGDQTGQQEAQVEVQPQQAPSGPLPQRTAMVRPTPPTNGRGAPSSFRVVETRSFQYFGRQDTDGYYHSVGHRGDPNGLRPVYRVTYSYTFYGSDPGYPAHHPPPPQNPAHYYPNY